MYCQSYMATSGTSTGGWGLCASLIFCGSYNCQYLRGGAKGLLAIGPREPDAVGGKTVEVGRHHIVVSPAAHLAPQIIDGNKKHIHRRCVRWCRRFGGMRRQTSRTHSSYDYNQEEADTYGPALGRPAA